MERQRIALAYSGSRPSSAAVRWFTETRGDAVIAVIVDVGQADDLGEVYARALSCGAMRAHVIDRRRAFAHHAVQALAELPPLDDDALKHLAEPVIAAALVELAAIEGADAVAHASRDECLDREIARVDPTRRVIAVAREWRASGADAAEYLRMHHLSPGAVRAERHLLIRPLTDVSLTADDEGADVTIAFEGGLPVSVNGVTMELEELVESLSLIGGQYGLSTSSALPSPAATLLHAAYQGLRPTAEGRREERTLQLKQRSLVIGKRRQAMDRVHAVEQERVVASAIRRKVTQS